MRVKRIPVRLKRPLLVNGRKQKAGDWVMIREPDALRLVERGVADRGDAWESTAEKHVLMVSKHCCTRVTKQAAALTQLGWRVDSLSSGMPALPQAFHNIRIENDEAEFADIIAASGAQIIHVHNEPDRLMKFADAGARDRPIVYDCHDLAWYRTFSVEPDELFAFDRADGIIHVSEEHRDLAYSLHQWAVPEAITLSTPLKAWMPLVFPPNRAGVVYEGGSTPGASNANRFRDHTHVEAAFLKAGIPMTLFVPVGAINAYKGGRQMIPYIRLLEELTKYKWGFIGTDIKTDKGDVCLPNKTFDYLLVGMPIVGCNVPAVERFLDGKAGVFANDMDTLIQKMREADWKQLAAEAGQARRFMDDEIKNTLKVYHSLLGTFSCDICGKTGFKTQLGVEGHKRNTHRVEYEAQRAAKLV